MISPAMATRTEHLSDRAEELLAEVRALREQVTALEAREAELRIIAEQNTLLEPYLERANRTVRKKANAPKATAAIEQAELQLEPCPYMVVDNFLPISLYRSLLRGIPPAALFKDNAFGSANLAVPFTLHRAATRSGRSSRAFCIWPSRATTSRGALAPLEAMHCERAVVATRLLDA